MELKFLFVYPPPALLTPLPFIRLTTEEITGCTIEKAKDADKASRNPPSLLPKQDFVYIKLL